MQMAELPPLYGCDGCCYQEIVSGPVAAGPQCLCRCLVVLAPVLSLSLQAGLLWSHRLTKPRLTLITDLSQVVGAHLHLSVHQGSP